MATSSSCGAGALARVVLPPGARQLGHASPVFLDSVILVSSGMRPFRQRHVHGGMAEPRLRTFADELPGVEVNTPVVLNRTLGEDEGCYLGDRGDREDIPEVLGSDVGDKEVDLLRGVRIAIGAAKPHGVGFRPDGFDLYAPEEAAATQDVVVRVAVAPGLGHAKAERERLTHESKFRDFSITFSREVESWVAERAGGILKMVGHRAP